MTSHKNGDIQYFQTIGPELAKRLLETMQFDGQRRLRLGWVNVLAEEMCRGKFRPKTQIFIANYNDTQTLIDGQHRLRAVIQSGVPIEFDVVETEVRDATELADLYSTTDIGGRRTDADKLRPYGLESAYGITETHLAKLSATVKFMLTGCMAAGGPAKIHQTRPLMDIYAPYLRQYLSVRDHCHPGARVWSGSLRSPTLALALLSLRFSAAKIGQEQVRTFWTGALLDDGLRQGDPRKVAYQHITEARLQTVGLGQRNQSVSAARSFRLLSSCFNAYATGRELRYPKVFDDRSAVNVYGTPSDPSLWW